MRETFCAIGARVDAKLASHPTSARSAQIGVELGIGTPELVLLALVFATVCAIIAHGKRRNTAGWAGRIQPVM